MPDEVTTLDVSGQACPMPVVRARQTIDTLGPGQVLELVTTDRGSLADIPAWARQLGHRVVSVADEGARFRFLIEKG